MYEEGISHILSSDFDNESEMKTLFPLWDLSFSKNGFPVAQEGKLKLHSFYDPLREADGLLSTVKDDDETLIFEGFGLGYAVISASEKFPDKRFILIENEASYFFASLALLDWQKVFSIEKLILAVSCSSEEAIKLINQQEVLKSKVISVQSQISHEQDYFSVLNTLIKRNRDKEEINFATTKKFGALWNRNCLRNAEAAVFSDDAGVFFNSAEGIPFLVIAAGPSLKEILPFIKEISKKCVTVCVDTALRALLTVNYQPDFVIITDPQYYAYRHLTGLKVPESILITSQDSYPPVFRFPCKKIVVSSSLMPVSKYYENLCGKKASLGSGGSVASCAFNFSKLCGAKRIYLSGLDLSFPEKQTHIKGSTFEQKAHSSSVKVSSSESKSMPYLFSGDAQEGENYLGEKVFTDRRMKMFAWWFESRIADSDCSDLEVLTLNSRGLKIPGVSISSVEKLLKEKNIIEEKKDFFRQAERKYLTQSEKKLLAEKFDLAEKKLSSLLKDTDVRDFYAVEKALKDYL